MQDTMNDLSGIDPLRLNAYGDTKDWLELLEREVVDADMTQSQEHGIDLMTGGQVYVETYQGGDGFVRNVQKQQRNGKVLTHRQIRAALNVMRRDLLNLPRDSRPQKDADSIPCYVCRETFPTWDDLVAHKAEAHSAGERVDAAAAEAKAKDAVKEDLRFHGTEQDVIANTTATKGLDLSHLPDGRYAVPNTSGIGKDPFIYLRVARVKRTTVRDRRYRYGAIVTGNEVVLAGTIEVRRYVSDTQELVGQQKPGDLYRGDFEDELDMVLLAPEAMAKVFGMQMGYCCICGKRLTDEISKALGMGIECERKEGYFTDTKWIKTHLAECPVCVDMEKHDESFHRPGGRPAFRGFDYQRKHSLYQCGHGHSWRVQEKGDPIVTEPEGWKPQAVDS